MTSATTRIKIFKLGDHVDMNGRAFRFGEDEARELIASYDAASDPAPLVIGHPETDAPAYGWVERLEVDDGVLFAEVERVDPEFAEMVNAGRYAKPSPSIYLAGNRHNPKPGKLYLKDVGFLGAAAAACKGLGTIRFAGAGAGDKDVATFDNPLNPTTKETSMSDKDAAAMFAEQAAALKADREKFDAERLAFDKARGEALHADHLSFAESLVKTARLSPAGKAIVVGVLDTLAAPAADAPLKFGEAGDMTPAAAFKALFDQAKPLVVFGEAAGKEKTAGDSGDGSDADDISNAALEFAEGQRAKGFTVDAATAVRHVIQKKGA